MQIFIFITCLFTGIVSGVVYDVLYIARCVLCGPYMAAYTVKDKIFLVVCDLVYCAVLSAGFMFIGCILGALVYLKSFHIIVAFFAKRVYNKIKTTKEKEDDGR